MWALMSNSNNPHGLTKPSTQSLLYMKAKFLEEREAASRIGERARGRATGDRGEQNTVYTQIDDICIKIIIEIR